MLIFPIVIIAGLRADRSYINEIDYLKIPNGICNKSIKYTIDKIVMKQDEKVIKSDIVIIISPKNKSIRLITESKKKGKIDFINTILEFSCTLNEDLTEGKANYSGYIMQPNGEKEPFYFFIETKKNKLTFISSPTKDITSAKYSMIVDKWEFID